MIPHRQSILAERPDGCAEDGTPGDCWRTAVASVLDVEDPLSLPHWGLSEDRWWEDTVEWVHENRKGDFIYIPISDEPGVDAWYEWWNFHRDRYGITHVVLHGPSPRGDFFHVVVGDAQTLLPVHDPHPSDGMLEEILGFSFFVPGVLVLDSETVRTA